MEWTAIVPLKRTDATKSRLAACLSPAARRALADAMAMHVLETLAAVPCVTEVRVLTPVRWPVDGPAWEPDQGAGLNDELDRVRGGIPGRSLLLIHGDLPLVTATEILTLCDEGRAQGIALAPDRREIGTNAIALSAGRRLAFGFGEASFARHRHAAGPGCAIVRAAGLAFDVDCEDDLALLQRSETF